MTTKATRLLLSGLGSNLLVVLLSLPLLRVPAGVVIKPMALICLIFVAGSLGPALHGTVAKDDTRPRGNRAVALLGSCLCFTPVPLALLLPNLFAWLRGFTFG
jgi:hypothetical protein